MHVCPMITFESLDVFKTRLKHEHFYADLIYLLLVVAAITVVVVAAVELCSKDGQADRVT